MAQNFNISTIDAVLAGNNEFREKVGVPKIDLLTTKPLEAGPSGVGVRLQAESETSMPPGLLGELGLKVFGWQFTRVKEAHHADAA